MLLLAGRFLELNRARLGLRSLRLSAEAEAALGRYRWPGNVRELEHAISRAALKAMSRGVSRNDIVTLQTDLLDLDGLELPVSAASQLPQAAAQAGLLSVMSLRDVVQNSQRQAIERALTTYQGNWAQAARALDLDASNLHKLARRLGFKDARSLTGPKTLGSVAP